jgi:hypothetical protein
LCTTAASLFGRGHDFCAEFRTKTLTARAQRWPLHVTSRACAGLLTRITLESTVMLLTSAFSLLAHSALHKTWCCPAGVRLRVAYSPCALLHATNLHFSLVCDSHTGSIHGVSHGKSQERAGGTIEGVDSQPTLQEHWPHHQQYQKLMKL